MNFQVCIVLALCACAFADQEVGKKTDKRNLFGLGYGYNGLHAPVVGPALHPHLPYPARLPYAPALHAPYHGHYPAAVARPIVAPYATPYAAPLTRPIAAPLAVAAAPYGLGYSGLGYSGLGYSGLGYSGLGYSGLGYPGYGY